MPSKRKGFSASQSKHTSRRIRSAMLGTHAGAAPHASGRMNADRVGFSNARRQKRATRGYVTNVMPYGSDYATRGSRVSERKFAKEVHRQGMKRRVLLVVGCIVAAAAVAAAVGMTTWYGSLEASISLGDSDAPSALTSAEEGAPFYTLVAASLDDANRDAPNATIDALALVRVDEERKQATILNVPPNIQTTLSDGNAYTLSSAQAEKGDAALIRSVSALIDVPVAHYVKADANGIIELVEALGGLEVNVREEVDDPAAGGTYIPAGTQTLDGRGVLTLLRATNFTEGIDQQAQNGRDVLQALSLRLVSGGQGELFGIVDRTDHPFGTDVGINDAGSIADAMAATDPASVFGTLVPGYEYERDGVKYYSVTSDALAAVMEAVEAGEDPAALEDESTVPPDSFTLTIRNGAAITGAAAAMEKTLSGLGFDVVDVGNTDTDAYNETLVIYKDDEFAPAAQTVIDTLGMGRGVLDQQGFYTFDSDVLLVIGKDWKPVE